MKSIFTRARIILTKSISGWIELHPTLEACVLGETRPDPAYDMACRNLGEENGIFDRKSDDFKPETISSGLTFMQFPSVGALDLSAHFWQHLCPGSRG
jgi:hypothetical protein